jgi:transposase
MPCEYSTGGKPRLLEMSKRGDVSLRKLLVHGARATLRWVETKPDDRSRWLKALIARRGKNRAGIMLANKNACIVWGLLAPNQEYRARPTG